MSDHPDIETLVAQWEQYLSRAESDGDTWTGVAHTDLRLLIAAWRAEKARADALQHEKDTDAWHTGWQEAVKRMNEAEARATQARLKLKETEAEVERLTRALADCRELFGPLPCDPETDEPWTDLGWTRNQLTLRSEFIDAQDVRIANLVAEVDRLTQELAEERAAFRRAAKDRDICRDKRVALTRALAEAQKTEG